MRIYTMRASQIIPAGIEQVWEFMSSPHNLQQITPAEMGLKITSGIAPDTKMHNGQLITYTLTPIFGIRMKWVTEITEVNALRHFTDIQQKGPYKLWEHKHSFTPVDEGVLMEDEVHYALPFGCLGILFHRPLIKPRLEKIFSYRKKIIEEKFGPIK